MDGRVGPGGHLGGEPVRPGHGEQEVGGVRGEFEEVVCFAAHDDEVAALGGGEEGGGGDGVEEAVEAGVVEVGGGVACCCDDADHYVAAHEVWGEC